MERNAQFHAPAALRPVKGLVVPTEYDLEGLQNLSECGENKYTSQQGIELRSSSTFFSHYADWDIQNKKKQWIKVVSTYGDWEHVVGRISSIIT